MNGKLLGARRDFILFIRMYKACPEVVPPVLLWCIALKGLFENGWMDGVNLEEGWNWERNA